MQKFKIRFYCKNYKWSNAQTRGKQPSDWEYLERYFKGNQPILEKNKIIRPDVNNKIVVNNPYVIVRHADGYF